MKEIDPVVKAYFDAQSPARRMIMECLRRILINTVPDLHEKMEWGVMCYGDLYYIANLPKQVNMGFSIIGLSAEEIQLFQGGGKTMRHLKFFTLENLDEAQLVKCIKLVREKASPVHSTKKRTK